MEQLLKVLNQLLRLFPELQSPLYLKAFLKWLATDGFENVTQFMHALKAGFASHLRDYANNHLGQVLSLTLDLPDEPVYATESNQLNFRDSKQEKLYSEFVGKSQTISHTRKLVLLPVRDTVTVEYIRLVKRGSLVCTPGELMVALNLIRESRSRMKPEEYSRLDLVCFVSLRPIEAEKSDTLMVVIHFDGGKSNFWSEFLGGEPVPSPETSIIEGVHVICPVNR
jgi:hypothetical protein